MSPSPKHILFVFACLCLAFQVFSQQGFDRVFHRSYAERSMLFDTLVRPGMKKLKPVAFFEQLSRMKERAKKEKDFGVQMELLFQEYEYKDVMGLTNMDEKIATLEKHLGSIDKEKYPEYTSRLMYDLGTNNFKRFNYTTAFEYYINVCQLVSGMDMKDFPDKKNMLVVIGNKYYNFGEYDKARQILIEADQLPPSWDLTINYSGKNTLGLIYRNSGSYDTAVQYFENVRTLAYREGNSIWEAFATGNIGITHYLQGDYEKAIPLLRADIKAGLRPEAKPQDNALNSLLILAGIHLEQDSLAEVAKEISIINHYIGNAGNQVKLLSMFYPVLAKYHYKTRDLGKAYAFQDSAAKYKDSLATRDNIYKLAKVELRKALEQHEIELQQMNTEKKLVEFTRNALIAGIAMLSVIALLVVGRLRFTHRINQDKLRDEKTRAEQNLATAAKDLENFTRHLQEKTALIEKSGVEIERLHAFMHSSKQQETNNEVLQQLYHSTILTDAQWEEFKRLFEQVYKGFLQRLKDRMPELSPADTRFIVLSKLRLSNKEMAGILGVQPDTIRTYKHRLRRKFNLSEDGNITELVDTI